VYCRYLGFLIGMILNTRQGWLPICLKRQIVGRQNINLKGKYLFAEAGETPDIEYLMAPIEDYVPFPEK
jgi:hypothetical protein